MKEKYYKGDTVNFNVSAVGLSGLAYVDLPGVIDTPLPLQIDGDKITGSFQTTGNMPTGRIPYRVFVVNPQVTTTVEVGSFLLVDASYISHAQKVLDAVEAVLENRSQKEHSEIEINGKKVVNLSPMELLQLRNAYKNEVYGERNRQRSFGIMIDTRFVGE